MRALRRFVKRLTSFVTSGRDEARLREEIEENGTVELTVTAKGLALFVMIESETDGRYSDNAFDLAAGESRRIVFTPAKPLAGSVPDFRFYDLQSSQSVASQSVD